MSILRTFRALWRMTALVFTLMLYVGFYIVRCWFKPHTIERGFRLRKAWVRLAFKILNIHIIEQEGRLPSFPCLFVVNHRNLIDPVIVASIIDAYFLAKAEVERYPFIGKGAKMTGVIYVIREAKGSRAQSRITMRETMKNNLNLVVYPEGTTGTEPKTIHFHKGSFEEAAALNFPVVPIAVEFKNQSDLWIQPSIIKQFMIQFGKKKTEIKIEIHAPIVSEDASYIIQQSQSLIDASLARMHKGWHELWR